jgi:hypothetical protein
VTRATDPELGGLRARFPDWTISTDTSGLLVAVLDGSDPAVIVRGEDAVDLADELLRADSRRDR